MPIYDRKCNTCGWTRQDCVEPSDHECACPHCGVNTVREWTCSAAIHGDDKFIGGVTFENMGHAPVTVHSRSEYKAALAARGLREFVRHQPPPGHDKSDKTTRWI